VVRHETKPYQTILYQSHRCLTNVGHQIITTFFALPKGAGTERIRAEMWQVIEDEGLSDYEIIYIDGSSKEEKVGCADVLPINKQKTNRQSLREVSQFVD
jgi:hypothetical protein